MFEMIKDSQEIKTRNHFIIYFSEYLMLVVAPRHPNFQKSISDPGL